MSRKRPKSLQVLRRKIAYRWQNLLCQFLLVMIILVDSNLLSASWMGECHGVSQQIVLRIVTNGLLLFNKVVVFPTHETELQEISICESKYIHLFV